MAWISFLMIVNGATTGSVLVLGTGLLNALMAMILGNIVMFAYVGLLGQLSARIASTLR